MNVYTKTDIIQFSFLKIPKTLFANPVYKTLSSDAKLAYALLYDRLSLSKQNNWINEKNEVYLIYTREEIAEDLGISYKKAISAFHELIRAELIAEKRCGRGMANRIYIAKPELTAKDADHYTRSEAARTADSACLEKTGEPDKQDIPSEELPDAHIKNGYSGISRTSETAHPELPIRHPIKTEYIKTDINQTKNSQSVSPFKISRNDFDGQADSNILNDIVENCCLSYFDEEVQKIFNDAIERLYYCETFKIGNAILPREKVRKKLRELDYSMLETALYKLHQNKDRPVKNMTAYVMSTVYNAITEEVSLLHIDPFLNSLRG